MVLFVISFSHPSSFSSSPFFFFIFLLQSSNVPFISITNINFIVWRHSLFIFHVFIHHQLVNIVSKYPIQDGQCNNRIHQFIP